MNSSRVPRKVLDSYFDTLSNWGRWGEDDQLGTLNLITEARRQAAMGLVRDGAVVDLAREISPSHAVDNPEPMLHHMLRSGEGAGEGFHGIIDWFAIASHGFAVTHLDSLNHIAWNGRLYNNRPASSVTTRHGGAFGSIGVGAARFTGRGVFFDVPHSRGVDWLDIGEGIFVEDLERCESISGCRVSEGDIMVVSTGRDARRRELGPWDFWREGTAGIDASCLPWLHERGVGVLVSDSGQDVMPSGYDDIPTPLHTIGIVAMGLWLLDNAYLEELQRACHRTQRWEFLFSCAPLRLKNSTGSPVTPLAIF